MEEVHADQRVINHDDDHKQAAKKEKSRLSAIFTVIFSGKPPISAFIAVCCTPSPVTLHVLT